MGDSVDINVRSLTDILLSDEKKRLSNPKEAITLSDIVSARLEKNMFASTMMYTPHDHINEVYQPTKLDISKIGTISNAVAMLILSAVSAQLMLETQMQGVETTMNQRISSSNTTMKQIKNKIKQARIKTPFQRFMKWLNGTAFMKFMQTEAGKIIMFAFSVVATIAAAVVTVVTGGAAAPALIIMAAALAMQITEFAADKSMGELITSGMNDDNKAKLALQMAIDIGLMIGMSVASANAAKVGNAAVKVGTATVKVAANISSGVSKLASVANAISRIGGSLARSIDIVQKIQRAFSSVMQIYGALYQLAAGMEQASLTKNAMEIDAIKTRSDSYDKFMNTIQEGQMADIQSLVNLVKDAFARAAQAIQESGEAEKAIARNINV
ncbi:MAG: hypothetical protein LBB20_00540 [Puniceicoccales bacterium]|jgi:hypothetical protein|nr:hypothetical protein [Puniceicoccales bacterium]